MGSDQATTHPLDSTLKSVLGDSVFADRGPVVFELERQIEDGQKSLKLEIGVQQQEAVFQELPALVRDHAFEDVDSLVPWLKRYADPEKSVVFVNDEGVFAVLEDEVEKGDRECVAVKYSLSEEWVGYADLFGSSCNHRKMLGFLRRNIHTLESAGVLNSMESAPVSSTVKSESNIKSDEKSYTVAFQSLAGEALRKFPKSFDIRLPVLSSDVADINSWVNLTIHLTIELPDSTEGKVAFVLRCPEFEMERRKRIQSEITSLRKLLGEKWMVLNGTAEFRVPERLACHPGTTPDELMPHSTVGRD